MCAAAAVLVWRPEWSPLAAVLVLAAWFFDRADGQLARRQNTVSRWGAWLDANVDEVGRRRAARGRGRGGRFADRFPLALALLAAFLAGKYLFMYGLGVEEHVAVEDTGARLRRAGRPAPQRLSPARQCRRAGPPVGRGPAHRLVVAELAIVAVYYNLRWIARYVLVARRLGGSR